MTQQLLGLPLEDAKILLAKCGITPLVETTSRPGGREAGVLRVVRVREEGKVLTVAYFLDPLAEAQNTEE